MLKLIPGDSHLQTFALFNDLFQLLLWKINSLPRFRCVHSNAMEELCSHKHTKTHKNTHISPCPHYNPSSSTGTESSFSPSGHQNTHLIFSPGLLFPHSPPPTGDIYQTITSCRNPSAITIRHEWEKQRAKREMEEDVAWVSKRWNPGIPSCLSLPAALLACFTAHNDFFSFSAEA